ncbi:unnamed protein product [Arabidopsis halleri]
MFKRSKFALLWSTSRSKLQKDILTQYDYGINSI